MERKRLHGAPGRRSGRPDAGVLRSTTSGCDPRPVCSEAAFLEATCPGSVPEQTGSEPTGPRCATQHTFLEANRLGSAPEQTPARSLRKKSAPEQTPARSLRKKSAPEQTPARSLRKKSAPEQTAARSLRKKSVPEQTPARSLRKKSAPDTLGQQTASAHVRAETDRSQVTLVPPCSGCSPRPGHAGTALFRVRPAARSPASLVLGGRRQRRRLATREGVMALARDGRAVELVEEGTHEVQGRGPRPAQDRDQTL
jgi:hypothetical protein